MRKHPSRLGKTKRCVHLRKFNISSAVAARAVSLLRRQNSENFEESEEEVGDWRENGSKKREVWIDEWRERSCD